MDITVTQIWQCYYLPYAGDGAVSAPLFRRWVTAGTKYSCLAAGGVSRAIHYLQHELMISIASVYFLLMMVKMGCVQSHLAEWNLKRLLHLPTSFGLPIHVCLLNAEYLQINWNANRELQ